MHTDPSLPLRMTRRGLKRFPKRMFRRERHRKPFIFKESEVPEEDYKDYCGSLVTHRDKLIELPAEALRRAKQIVY